jgi:hypothetical protein
MKSTRSILKKNNWQNPWWFQNFFVPLPLLKDSSVLRHIADCFSFLFRLFVLALLVKVVPIFFGNELLRSQINREKQVYGDIY